MYVFVKQNQGEESKVMAQGTLKEVCKVAGVDYKKVQQSYKEHLNDWEDLQECYDSKEEYITEWVYWLTAYGDGNHDRIYCVPQEEENRPRVISPNPVEEHKAESRKVWSVMDFVVHIIGACCTMGGSLIWWTIPMAIIGAVKPQRTHIGWKTLFFGWIYLIYTLIKK